MEVQTTLEPPLEYDQDQTTLMNKVYYDLFKKYTNADLKISLFAKVHIKTIP